MEHIIQNLEHLKRQRPDLAEKIILPLPQRVELLPGKSGQLTLVYRSQKGEKLLHSRYDPLREAQSYAESLKGNWDHLILMGLGIGYHILPLLDTKTKQQRILVYEPDPAIFSASLHIIDWGRLLSSRDDLFLVVGNDEQKLAEEVQRFFSLSSYQKLEVSVFPGEKSLFPEIFQQVEESIDSQIRTLFYDFKTRLAEGGMTSQNILHNLPHILNTRPLRALSNRFQGTPGIIVSAGPSLDDNIMLLKRNRNRAMIIAVDTALKPLLARGIQPHFTVTADPSHKNYRHLLGTQERISHYLLAESAVSTRLFQDFTTRIFTVSIGKPLLNFCESATGPIGELEAWGSVISLAFSFAIHLGLAPLTFIGQDFAYTHMRNHCRHSSWEEALLLENPSLENLQRFERQSISGQMVEKKDIFERPIYTSDRLALYKDYLARMISTVTDRTIFNSSEGGILKELPFLPLEEFLRRYTPNRPQLDLALLEKIPIIGTPRTKEELKLLFNSQIRFLKKYWRKLNSMNERLSTQDLVPSRDLLDEAENLKQVLYRQGEHGDLVEMWSQFPIYSFLNGQKKLPSETDKPNYNAALLALYRTYFRSLSTQLTHMITAFENAVTMLVP